jgi:hypothetical protein
MPSLVKQTVFPHHGNPGAEMHVPHLRKRGIQSQKQQYYSESKNIKTLSLIPNIKNFIGNFLTTLRDYN